MCCSTFLGLGFQGGSRYKNRPGFPYGFPITDIELIKPQLGRVALVLTHSSGVSAPGWFLNQFPLRQEVL